MGVATTYNPGANAASVPPSGALEPAALMSRFTAILFLVFAAWVSPAFSADPLPGTTLPGLSGAPQPIPLGMPPADDIDPATGLARSTVVRPLIDPVAADPRSMAPLVRRSHIALILPISSPQLGSLATALRMGFVAAAAAAGKEAMPVNVIAIEAEGQALVDACRISRSAGALLVVGGLTRDGAVALAASECSRAPVLTLNEPRETNANVFIISLSLENEARQAALHAVESGLRSAIVIHSQAPVSKRVQEAFEREWIRAAGEMRRLAYSGNPEEAPAIRERIASSRGDMVFLALDSGEALAIRPYVSGGLPVYATSLGVNPRAEPLVNLDLQGLRYVEMPWFIQPDHPAVMAYTRPASLQSVDQERLYALGIDAYRLALLVVKGEAISSSLDGVTGRISLEAGNHFVRTLSPAEVDGGRVIPLRSQ